MTNTLRVSCIVPVFNGERFLADTLRSILSQSLPPVEVIVIDDGSTDGTPEVVAGFGDAVAYTRQANTGQPAALNRGIGLALGDWVAFCDCDDLWDRDKLRKQAEFLSEHDGMAGCGALVQNFWEAALSAEARQFARHPRGQPIPGLSFSTLLCQRDAFERHGRFNERMRHAADAEWVARIRDAGEEIGVLEEVLVLRRLHAMNTSRRSAEASRDEYLRMLKNRLDRLRGEQDKKPFNP